MKKEFNEVYSDTYEHVLKYVICHCSNISDINDIIQETYFSLYKALLKDNHIDNILNYVIGIADKKIKDYYRKSYRLKRTTSEIITTNDIEDVDLLELIPSDFDLENIVFTKLEEERLMNIINTKDPLIGKIFYLYFYFGYTIKEVAKTLNISESNVKSKIYRTIKECKKKLNRSDFNA